MKTYSEGFPNVTRKTNRGERNQFIAVGSYPAIIPKDIFEKVAAMREERSNVTKDSDGTIRKPTRYSMKKAMVDGEKPSE
jgi:hypothetical protein